VVAAAVLVVAAVAGARGWLDTPDRAPRADPAPAAATPSGSTPTVVPRAQEAAGPTAVEQWRAVVDGLYRRRAEAFATASPRLLEAVYAAGSPLLTADVALATTLADAGEVLRGFAPAVEEVTAARADGDRVRLELVDSWAPYEVVRDGAAVRPGPGRPPATVRMVLVRSGDSWLIESAERAA
jgi:eukaryotic-like serine/threonine-protein kinase